MLQVLKAHLELLVFNYKTIFCGNKWKVPVCVTI